MPAASPPSPAPLAPTTAILLCNLGTPDAPTAPALRRYLAQFLGDPRVVEIPRLVWLPILHGIILRIRPAKSAAKYATIWTPEGSPLAVWTAKQALMLRGWLGEAGHAVRVQHAMRYGQPAIGAQLQALQDAGVQRVLVLPLYPQYSSTTTASLFDDVAAWVKRARVYPELRFVNGYHDHPGYIGALADSVRAHWQREGGPAERLVMSFHGIPERNVRLGDPYADQCRTTARLLAQALGLTEQQWQITFQSRFGKARWLEPYTEPTLVALAQAGTRRVDVMCPGFTSDCLETLEEINQEARHAFMEAGGKEFRYIPCLNDDPAWITALSQIAEQHLAGWPTASL
ncbi:MAG TPA: ferrochelatase [Comamonadaceae bacterium]|uniref:ferrochelatase n=1 Tax=Pulveribacter sp. TaxID=2678893 RepID=UPI000EEE8F5F|nr:ferrochelatase [Pulveribacter sp.]HCL86025.1 ferrochelatase [Comamonadaceae bacterium]